jgi:hypothetical protein
MVNTENHRPTGSTGGAFSPVRVGGSLARLGWSTRDGSKKLGARGANRFRAGRVGEPCRDVGVSQDLVRCLGQRHRFQKPTTELRTWTGTPNTSPYNVWASVSLDGGKSFTTPLEVSNGDSPAPSPINMGPFFATIGDDFSYITFNNHDAFVGWTDWRVTDSQGYPERQGFISIIPLAAFFGSDHDPA